MSGNRKVTETLLNKEIAISGTSNGNKVPIQVNSQGQLSLSLSTNNALGDAFGRLRVSEPGTVFENKLLDGSGVSIWDDESLKRLYEYF